MANSDILRFPAVVGEREAQTVVCFELFKHSDVSLVSCQLMLVKLSSLLEGNKPQRFSIPTFYYYLLSCFTN